MLNSSGWALISWRKWCRDLVIYRFSYRTLEVRTCPIMWSSSCYLKWSCDLTDGSFMLFEVIMWSHWWLIHVVESEVIWWTWDPVTGLWRCAQALLLWSDLVIWWSGDPVMGLWRCAQALLLWSDLVIWWSDDPVIQWWVSGGVRRLCCCEVIWWSGDLMIQWSSDGSLEVWAGSVSWIWILLLIDGNTTGSWAPSSNRCFK